MKPKDTESAIEMLEFAKRLGYSLVCLEISSDIDYVKVKDIAEKLGVLLCHRVTIDGKTRRDVRKELEEVKKQHKWLNPIIIVNAKTLDSLRYSASNKEIALTRIEPGEERLIDKSQARLFAQRGWGAIEIVLRPVLLEGRMDYLATAITRSLRSRLDLVVSSDSREAWEMWSPYHIIGLLVTLGVPEGIARTWISSVAARIIEGILRRASQEKHPTRMR